MMKSILFSLLGLFVCMTVNAEGIDEVVAETEVSTSNEIHYPVLNPTIEGSSALTTPYQVTLPTIDEGYRQSQDWKNAVHLRNAGAIVCSAGLVGYVAGAAIMFSGIFNSETSGNVNGALGGLVTWEKGLVVSLVSLAPVTAGAIMWGIGNHKMKKIRLQYTGNGLSMNF